MSREDRQRRRQERRAEREARRESGEGGGFFQRLFGGASVGQVATGVGDAAEAFGRSLRRETGGGGGIVAQTLAPPDPPDFVEQLTGGVINAPTALMIGGAFALAWTVSQQVED